MNTQKIKKRIKNEINVTFPSLSVNEGFARSVCSVFFAQLDPTATELSDVKCAVSEAVTNCIVHAYRGSIGTISLKACILDGNDIRISVRDTGCGIENIREAMRPTFTTDSEGERSGMGFTVMESFMDKVKVRSKPGRGTTVTMFKHLTLIDDNIE